MTTAPLHLPAPVDDRGDAVLERWRAAAWWRWRALVVLEALAWGVAAGLCVSGFGGAIWLAVLVGALAVIARATTGQKLRDVRVLLLATERAHPALANALLAWHEVDRGTLRAPVGFRQRLAAHAARTLDDRAVPPPFDRGVWWRAWALMAVGLVVALVVPHRARPAADAATAGPTPTAASTVARVAVTVVYTITPPAYTGRPSVVLENPPTVEALVGSRVAASFTGLPPDASVRFGADVLPLTTDADARVASLTVVGSGLLIAADASGAPILSTAVQAVDDAAPLVRVSAPGRDVRTDDVRARVDVRVDASDDIGLSSLRVRYTRVTGSGESFEFVDGELPLTVQRQHASWQASGVIDLGTLSMGPGDSLVYWAVARDGRSDASGVAESERFLVEIPRPGQLPAGDFSLPEPEDRFALSQRMVIQLTEQLLERRPRMDAQTFTDEAQALAIQQRRVRAEFVFLMGGEVVDEVEEAAHSHEVEAGRLDNSGQQELLEAVRQMAQAEQRLTDADLDAALPFEYRALNALQAAFGKARYFMRTLPTRVAIDPSRRGSGDMSLARSGAWTFAALPPSRVAEGRRVLRDLLDLGVDASAPDIARLTDALVALDADGGDWLALVRTLSEAFAPGRPADTRRTALEAAARVLRTRLAGASPRVLDLPLSADADEAALAEAARDEGGSRP